MDSWVKYELKINIYSRRVHVKLPALASKLFQVIDSQVYSSAGFSGSITFKLFSSVQNTNFQVCVNYKCSYSEKIFTSANSHEQLPKELHSCWESALKICISPPFIFTLTSGVSWANIFILFRLVRRHGIWFKIISEDVREFRTTEKCTGKMWGVYLT